MKYTLRHIQVFLAIARYESISRAAETLSMSQSAVSSALSEFESRYEVLLFDRSGKRLQLNALGREMRTQAQALMIHAQEFEHQLLEREAPTELTVAASFTIGNYLAVKQVATFILQHPGAKVDMKVASTPEVVKAVANFEVDLGLIEADVRHEELQFEPWCNDRMLIVCAPAHPLASKSLLSDKDLLKAKWILREPSSGHRQTFDRSMQGLLPKIDVVLELTHNEAVKNAVKAGMGLGCLSEIAVADELAQGLLVALSAQHRPMNRQFYFVTRRHGSNKKAVQSWIDLCRQSTN